MPDLVDRLRTVSELIPGERGRLVREAVDEIERLRAENARLLRLIEDDPYEEICERMDAEAHAFLDEIGKGHRKPACSFGDGPADVVKEARRLAARHAALLSACVLPCFLSGQFDEWFVAPFGWSSGPFAGLNPRGFVSEAEARAALEGAVGELAGGGEKRTMRVKDAAQYLTERGYTCSPGTVRALVRAGRLTSYRIGVGRQGRMEFTPEWLDAFLKGPATGQAGAAKAPAPALTVRLPAPARPAPAEVKAAQASSNWRDEIKTEARK